MLKNKTVISRILKDKRIAGISIFLCLAILIIFQLQEKSQATMIGQNDKKSAFMIETEEYAAKPADYADDISYTKTDAIMFEKFIDERTNCANESIIATEPDFNADLTKVRLRVPILMYHYIEEPGGSKLPWLYHSPQIFEAQLKTLANNCYRTVFVSDVSKSMEGSEILPQKSIALTFDDGYEDMYTTAYPLLKKYGMKGTMYIIVNALDTPGYLTREQVKEMAESGAVEISSHTMNHANMQKSNFTNASYEMIASRQELEKIIGRPVTNFAYPYGLFTLRDEHICKSAGYSSCVSTYPGQIQTNNKKYSLYRLRPGYRVGPALINWLELSGPKR